MGNDLDKKVAQLIIKAQMCSDSGKRVNNDYFHPGWKKRANKFRYSHKVELIIRAMDRIAQMHGTSGFHYSIGNDGFDIVYFDFKIEEKRYQISFHIPEGVPKRYKKCNDKHVTHWDHNSSREACYALSAWIG
jgi:hypothetical protein